MTEIKYICAKDTCVENIYLKAKYTDGTERRYELTQLGVDWIRLNSNQFFAKYGFDFNPHKYEGLYEKCYEIARNQPKEPDKTKLLDKTIEETMEHICSICKYPYITSDKTEQICICENCGVPGMLNEIYYIGKGE